MKKFLFAAILAVATLLISGCGTTAKFVYPAKMESLVRLNTSSIYQKNVAVLPFEDFRNSLNLSSTLLLSYVPLWPYGWLEYDRPDAARMFLTINEFQFTPSEDLSKAAAVSLRRSNLFKDVYFSFGGDTENADFVLTGELNGTKYKGYMITYGLSSFGSFLWLFGAPCGFSDNQLSLVLVLKQKDKIIWEYTFDRSREIWQWYYYRFGHDGLGYAELMQECMNEAIIDLAKHLAENPELFE